MRLLIIEDEKKTSEYLRKGRSVYIEGRLQSREWEDKDGNKRYTTEINANTVNFIGPRVGGGDSGGGGGSEGYSSGGGRSGGAGPIDSGPPIDDDIPF